MNPTRWQVCIFAVYMGSGGKLLGKEGCPFSEGWKGKCEVPLEKESENLFRLHMCTSVHDYVDGEKPTAKIWLADCAPFQCPRITSGDLYLVWK